MGISRNSFTMQLITRALAWLGLTEDTAPLVVRETGAQLIPIRSAVTLTARQVTTMPDVFRALQVLTIAAGQLPIIEEGTDGRRLATPSALVRRPSVSMTRTAWVQALVMDLATRGNAYILQRRATTNGPVLSLDVLPAAEVLTDRDPMTGRPLHHYQGRTYTSADMTHLVLIQVPGSVCGVGPVEACRRGLSTADAMTSYLSDWWQNGPATTNLTTDQTLTPDQAKAVRRIYNGRDPITGEVVDQSDNPERVRVLTGGVKVERSLLKPADMLWLDAQRYTSTQVARVFGIPASLMLAAIEGGSRTYANVEQEWIAFARFTLMSYLRPIEDALTDLLPRGRTARFNLDALLRADTMTRYQAHAVAIAAGFMTPAYAAAIESLPAPEQQTTAQLDPTTQELPA